MNDLAIVESRADDASVHVCDRLRAIEDWDRLTDDARPDADGGGTYWRADGVELRSFDDWHLELTRPAGAFDCDPDLLVFASRHAGDTGPLLTAHFTGNVGPAEFGGDDHAVAAAAPNALARLYEAFETYAPEGYDVGLECTHHGPTDVGCPSLFAELGSDEAQWADPAGAEAVASAILDLRGVPPNRDAGGNETGEDEAGGEVAADAGDDEASTTPDPGDRPRHRQVVGFGGGHYVPRFERIVRETPWAVGHVAADWPLDALDEADPGPETRRRLFRDLAAASGTDLAVVEGDRPDLEADLRDLGIRVVSETWLRAVGDRPLDLVEAVEGSLGRVDDGVRFGDRETTAFGVVDLPDDLLATAAGVDAEATLGALAGHAVAFETVDSGARPGDRAALPTTLLDDRPEGATLPDPLVAVLTSVLEARFDVVAVEADVVVAEETAFDPALARELGVPEGPAFGALADGESVTVDGERIDPGAVHVERTHRFPR